MKTIYKIFKAILYVLGALTCSVFAFFWLIYGDMFLGIFVLFLAICIALYGLYRLFIKLYLKKEYERTAGIVNFMKNSEQYYFTKQL